ncbi:GNAT family N-acetyltransferase [bacterium]|nr:MAG: GNAT family N-acetyltransferase [bacterium]
MTEIRNLRDDEEAEAFLQLLCRVFGLDPDRARDVFFNEPLFDLDRKWALFEAGEMVSVLTTTPLEFGWGRAVGVAGVCTDPDRQREGFAGRLLERVIRESERRGEGAMLLFAQRLDLYESVGFEPIDRVIRAPLNLVLEDRFQAMDWTEARAVYDAWSQAAPDRLRRDNRRWKYWEWHYRTARRVGAGYVCEENGTLREGLWHRTEVGLPLPTGTEWFGLTATADLLGLTFDRAVEESILMGRNFPGVPVMFMTDQF